MPRPADLPDYEQPPVSEVALGVQFDPLPNLGSTHLGLLWDRFKVDYPVVEEHPPLPPIEERFGVAAPTGPTFEFMIGPAPVPRVWFANPDGSRLIQVQQDRFIHNWRSTQQAPDYPRYPELREGFESHYATFRAFLEDLGTKVAARQAEISYVNFLQPGQGWDRPGELYRVLRPLSARDPDTLLGVPEDARYAERHVIDGDGGPYARLYVVAEPLINGALHLTLTVRGRPEDTSPEALLAFFDMGRERIVRGFDSVTTDEMHRIWKKKGTS